MRGAIRYARRALSPQVLAQQCADFNARFPIGQKVTVRKDDGTGMNTTTRSEAQVLSGHSAVIWVDGIPGCYLLDRITPLVEGPAL